MHLYLLSRARHQWAFFPRREFFLALSLNFLIFMEILDELLDSRPLLDQELD